MNGAEGRGPVTLDVLRPGTGGEIRAVHARPAASQRLLEMGLTPGTSVEVIRLAPLGDPMEVRVRGYLLSVRREDARRIEVLPENGR